MIYLHDESKLCETIIIINKNKGLIRYIDTTNLNIINYEDNVYIRSKKNIRRIIPIYHNVKSYPTLLAGLTIRSLKYPFH